MAIDFSAAKYNKPSQARRFPVLLLLDVSGSMSGSNITALNDATMEMIREFSKDLGGEKEVDIAIITFNTRAQLHQNVLFKPAKDWLNDGFQGFTASGSTNLEMALEMAYDILEDPDTFKAKIYHPAIILVSDGAPDSGWEPAFYKFITMGNSSKAERFAVSVGSQPPQQMEMLLKFVTNPTNLEDKPDTRLIEADDAAGIASAFKFISTTVAQRATSRNPNTISTGTPSNTRTQDENTKQPAPPLSRPSIDDDDDDDDDYN